VSCNCLFSEDLDHVLAHTRDLWEEVRGQRLFVTGGTGFFGTWLVESFLWIEARLDLGTQMVVLSRNPQRFLARLPHLADRAALKFQVGDVRDFDFPQGSFSHIVHAATASSGTLGRDRPLEMLDTIVEGTRHSLDFAVQCKAQKVLFTSSGAMYGRQSPEFPRVPEDCSTAPDPVDPWAVYGHGKRMAEHLGTLYARMHGIEFKIARCFAFIGPHLPLDAHFAIGNFIRDGLRGGPIVVEGDGTPERSYLYAADLAIWLWTILLRGPSCRPYNVGSDAAVSIAELARRVASVLKPAPEVQVRQLAGACPPVRYIPDIDRARRELNLDVKIGLDDGLRRTVAWSSSRKP
jgi:dTDP-glucose 4,6-dehydratase